LKIDSPQLAKDHNTMSALEHCKFGLGTILAERWKPMIYYFYTISVTLFQLSLAIVFLLICQLMCIASVATINLLVSLLFNTMI